MVAVVEELLSDGSGSSIVGNGEAGTGLAGEEGTAGGVYDGDFVGVRGGCRGELAGKAAMGI